WRSIASFQIRRASAYSGSVGRISAPLKSVSVEITFIDALALTHRLVDDVAVVPLRLRLQVLEHRPISLIHLRALRVLLVQVLVLEDHAHPDLARIGVATKDRGVDPPWRSR